MFSIGISDRNTHAATFPMQTFCFMVSANLANLGATSTRLLRRPEHPDP